MQTRNAPCVLVIFLYRLAVDIVEVMREGLEVPEGFYLGDNFLRVCHQIVVINEQDVLWVLIVARTECGVGAFEVLDKRTVQKLGQVLRLGYLDK